MAEYTGTDPDVIGAVTFWRSQGNEAMAQRVIAANTPGATVPTATITPEQAAAAGLPSDPNVIGQVGGTIPWAQPASPTPPPVVAPSPPSSSGPDNSARAAIQATLDAVGLGDLGDWAWNQYLAGSPIQQILLDMRSQPAWVSQFGVINTLAKQGVTGISEQDVINYRSTVRQLFGSYGIPSGFFDSKDDLDALMVHGRSAAEVKADLDLHQQVALQSPPEVQDALQRLYGVGPGDLTAFFIDPDKTLGLLQKRVAAATLAGTATRTGYGALDQTQAERLAALGVTQDQAQQGFSQLGQQAELFTPLNAGETAIGTNEQLGAQFGGDIAAQQAIRTRQRQRIAAFQSGGAYATGKYGTTGLASAAS